MLDGHTEHMSVRDAMAMFQLRVDHRTEVACARILSAFGAGHADAPFPESVVAKVRDELGGEYAVSRIPESRAGTCAVFYRGSFRRYCAVFPTYRQAAVAARMAIDPTIGGYSDVVIEAGIAAPLNAEFYLSASDWL